MTCGIYMLTNTKNNKVYVGQSINIERRWLQHQTCKEARPLYKDMKKHGLDAFTFEILLECSVEDLDKYEIKCIAEYEAFGKKGYNLTSGGKGAADRTLVNKTIGSDKTSIAEALANKDYKQLVWGLVAYEFAQASSGNTENRLGQTLLSVLVKTMSDMEKGKPGTDGKVAGLKDEIAEWLASS